MQDGVEPFAEQRIDLGDVAIERGPQGTGAEQAGKSVAEPGAQGVRGIEPTVEEAASCAAVRMAVAEVSASQAASRNWQAERRLARQGGCRRLRLQAPPLSSHHFRHASADPAPPGLAGAGRQAAGGSAPDQARFGMLATMRRLVVSSSICSQGLQVGNGIVGAGLARDLLHLDPRFTQREAGLHLLAGVVVGIDVVLDPAVQPGLDVARFHERADLVARHHLQVMGERGWSP